jgi:hypothetical protein
VEPLRSPNCEASCKYAGKAEMPNASFREAVVVDATLRPAVVDEASRLTKWSGES